MSRLLNPLTDAVDLTQPLPSMKKPFFLNDQVWYQLWGERRYFTWPLINSPIVWWQVIMIALFVLSSLGLLGYAICRDRTVAATRRVAASKHRNLKFQKRKRLVGRTAM